MIPGMGFVNVVVFQLVCWILIIPGMIVGNLQGYFSIPEMRFVILVGCWECWIGLFVGLAGSVRFYLSFCDSGSGCCDSDWLLMIRDRILVTRDGIFVIGV